ncbi:MULTISPECIES: SET domain-containing protein [Paenibacillus]|uniref:SET domain-containing protein n=1 Tax=Paenibacillus residui TaxID=629724 RepID=A0ABW3D699_9BACL|nr:SET domain-containing protein [Paenibacillus sp. 32O-W]
MIHPDTELRFVNEKIGLGVFATKFIPKGTIVWVLDDLDMILDEDYVDSLEPLRRDIVYKYAYQNEKGEYVLCWDHGRYINHSFNPNCIGTAYELELAARDIHPGEELTSDYGILGDEEPFVCVPEEGTSRTIVMPDDYLHYYRLWDEMAAEAFKYFNQVDQPLKHLIPRKFRKKVHAVAAGLRPLDSILTTF